MKSPDAAVKRAVRERDGMRCVRCGMTNDRHRVEYNGKSLHVHRKVPGSAYTLHGCETLCTVCHGPEPRSKPCGLGNRPPKTKWAALLVSVLKHTGWTEYRLARESGIKPQAVARLRTGSVPLLDTVETILKAAGLDWAWLDTNLSAEKTAGKK